MMLNDFVMPNMFMEELVNFQNDIKWLSDA
jgi:hypothetical protein